MIASHLIDVTQWITEAQQLPLSGCNNDTVVS